MRIVVDTNVIISGIFFGGNPLKVVNAIIDSKVVACATDKIIEEYIEIINKMIMDKQGKFNSDFLSVLINSFELINSKSNIKISRDPDDDKFIECALDGNALYIVSGDNDLLDIKKYKDIKILTAKEFCDKYL